jgi:hypothetical protein
MSESEEVIVFVPHIDDGWLLQCNEHCDHCGYTYSIIVADEAAVARALLAGAARKVVVARAEHFQPDWWPTIEVVASARTPPGRRREHRPNIVP